MIILPYTDTILKTRVNGLQSIISINAFKYDELPFGYALGFFTSTADRQLVLTSSLVYIMFSFEVTKCAYIIDEYYIR